MTAQDLVGKEVTHIKYGAGVIENFADRRMVISFPDESQRTFIYPDAFEKFLNTEDEAMTQLIEKDIQGRQHDEDYVGRTKIVSEYQKVREFAKKKQEKQELKLQEQIDKRMKQVRLSEQRMQKREQA